MDKNRISFFCEDTDFTLSKPSKIKAWLEHVAEHYNTSIASVNYIFCSDNYLLNINQSYLNHDEYTDIITFDQSEEDGIAADIFISIDRITENAITFNTPTEQELHRVMVHGILHIIGFNDHTNDEKKVMRKTEEACLSLLKL